MEKIILEKITCDTWRSEALPSGKYLLQIIGGGSLIVRQSVDGQRFSALRAQSITTSALHLLDLPNGGQFTVEMTGVAEGETPEIYYITTPKKS